MEIRALYEIGERVIVKDLATLREELGDPIDAQCGWYASGMNEYAGKGGIVSAVKEGINGGYYVYRLKGFGLWWFSEDTLKPSDDVGLIDFSITLNDILEGTQWQQKHR